MIKKKSKPRTSAEQTIKGTAQQLHLTEEELQIIWARSTLTVDEVKALIQFYHRKLGRLSHCDPTDPETEHLIRQSLARMEFWRRSIESTGTPRL